MLYKKLKSLTQHWWQTDKRHPLFTVIILNLYLIANILEFGLVPWYFYTINPNALSNIPLIYRALPLLNVICLIAIVRYKKWGFYGLGLVSTLLFLTDSYHQRYWVGLSHYLPLLVLYLALQVRKPRSTWEQMT